VKPEDINIDVIIPTKNRVNDLIELIEILLYQEEVRPRRIIIVDDGDYDALEKALYDRGITKRASLFAVELVHVRGLGRGLTAARNIGLKYSSSELVIFFDDDVLISKNFLKLVKETFIKHPYIKGLSGLITDVVKNEITGRYKVALPSLMKNRLINALMRALHLWHYRNNECGLTRVLYPYYPYPVVENKVIKTEFLPGAFICVRKEVFESHEIRFDENLALLNSPLEDADFSLKLKLREIPIYVSKNLVVFHKKLLIGSVKRSIASPPTRNTVIISAVYRFYLLSKYHRTNILRYILFFLSFLVEYLMGCLDPRRPVIERKKVILTISTLIFIVKNLPLILSNDLTYINQKLKKALDSG